MRIVDRVKKRFVETAQGAVMGYLRCSTALPDRGRDVAPGLY